MRYDAFMNLRSWFRERRTTLLVVGILVPALATLTFWNVVRSEWPFWLACYAVGFPTAIALTWGRKQLSETFGGFAKSHRMLLRCLAIVSLWCLLVLVEHDWSEASWTAAAAALLWGGFLAFSRGADTIWSRIRKR